MAQNSFTPSQMEKLLQVASQQLGKSPEELKTAFEQGGLGGISSSLSPSEVSKAEAILKDKDKTAQLLASPAVQQLLHKLLGDA